MLTGTQRVWKKGNEGHGVACAEHRSQARISGSLPETSPASPAGNAGLSHALLASCVSSLRALSYGPGRHHGASHLCALARAGPFAWTFLHSTTFPLTCSLSFPKPCRSSETEPGIALETAGQEALFHGFTVMVRICFPGHCLVSSRSPTCLARGQDLWQAFQYSRHFERCLGLSGAPRGLQRTTE